MNFTWNMTENNWRNLVNDHKKHTFDSLSDDYDFYGNCCIGNICAEIMHTGDDSDDTSWYSFTNIYALGINDGYGETVKRKMPYALLNDSFKIPVECSTFERFKAEFEKRFMEMINSKEQYTKLANMPLGDWN